MQRGLFEYYEVRFRVCAIFLIVFHLCFDIRHRPALGECLAHLANAMPVAFLEPNLNEYNAFSVYTTKTPRERTSQSHSMHVKYMCVNFFLLLTQPSFIYSPGPSQQRQGTVFGHSRARHPHEGDRRSG